MTENNLPVDLVLEGGGRSSGNRDSSEGRENNLSSDRSVSKPRFNWKHRYLTSHGSAGINGQVCAGTTTIVYTQHSLDH